MQLFGDRKAAEKAYRLIEPEFTLPEIKSRFDDSKENILAMN
jgi:hypothetical protein